MNLGKFKVPSPWKSKSTKSQIRSPAFRKKYQDGMPRINHKAIPFHNIYDVQIKNAEIAKEHGLKFWGCVTQQRKKPRKSRLSNRSCNLERRMSQTRPQSRSQNMFRKYMKRRPSLSLTPRSYELISTEIGDEFSNNQQTLIDFSPEKVKLKNMSLKIKTTGGQGHKQSQSLIITNEEISSLNKKKVQDMKPLQLEISIEWKKRFLQTFEKKLREVKKF